MNAHEFLSVSDYCRLYKTEPDFIDRLEEFGLIELESGTAAKYILTDKLNDLERLRILHYELHVNLEGIDIIQRLLSQYADLERDLEQLKRRIRLYE